MLLWIGPSLKTYVRFISDDFCCNNCLLLVLSKRMWESSPMKAAVITTATLTISAPWAPTRSEIWLCLSRLALLATDWLLLSGMVCVTSCYACTDKPTATLASAPWASTCPCHNCFLLLLSKLMWESSPMGNLAHVRMAFRSAYAALAHGFSTCVGPCCNMPLIPGEAGGCVIRILFPMMTVVRIIGFLFVWIVFCASSSSLPSKKSEWRECLQWILLFLRYQC